MGAQEQANKAVAEAHWNSMYAKDWADVASRFADDAEYMDVGASNGWRMDDVVPSAEIVRRINAEMPLEQMLGESCSMGRAAARACHHHLRRAALQPCGQFRDRGSKCLRLPPHDLRRFAEFHCHAAVMLEHRRIFP